ncbi:phage tail tape measure protein [Chromobacterium sp. S0633]|uniref:phage tail tape measure protein n=1 Tax=Chromobacterium sp. S0633 TaxID=2957805 RepID=UPI00209F4CCB|nr:phage tail tape measure protein [Chromobacterium sp. S0633]MCP1290743.1 phage tail tape measure protein [Chromobacterium sp. S0633]
MAREPEVGLTLKYRDEASRPLARSMQDLEKNTQRAEKAVIGLSRESQRMASAREQLGVRSERTIQREIQQTEAAYKRLASSGTMTAREQTRAYSAMRDQVKELRREMRGVSELQRNLSTGAKVLTAVAGGVAAGAYVVGQPVKRTMDYDRRLAMMSNTAYAERDIGGRRAGMRELDGAIQQAVRIGGGSREGAAETLDNLIASGAMSQQSATKLLPVLQKYSTGTGADPNELGNIAIRAMQTFKIKEHELPKLLDMSIMAGQAGGFELKDMAKWLPQQMAAAKQSGMNGMSGAAKLLALNQAAVITAGTKDEAGNNVVNLLAKINSQDTAKDASKISSTTFQAKKKGEKGIDLAGTLAAAREKGMDSLDAFVGLVDKVVAHDKRYQSIQGKLKSAKGDERKALLDSQADILQGSAIGTLIQDRQALMALVGYMGNREYVNGIVAKLPNAAGTGDANFGLIQGTASFQAERARNEKTIAEQKAFDGLSSTIGDVAGKLADYAQEYPGLSAVLAGTTVAIGALGAAAGAAALPMLLLGKGGGGAKLPGGVLPKTGPAARNLPVAGAGLGLTAVSLANFTTDQEDDELKHGDARWKRLRAQYSQAQIDAARKRYQPWYQFGKGYAAENEQWLQRYAQDEARAKAPPIDLRNAPSSAAPIPQLNMLQSTMNAATKLDVAAQKMQQAVNQPMQIQLTGEFRVNGSDLVAVVNQSNSTQARRN